MFDLSDMQLNVIEDQNLREKVENALFVFLSLSVAIPCYMMAFLLCILR
nr:MAG TPA: hypothetical protein [Caudoviricetes sp.]